MSEESSSVAAPPEEEKMARRVLREFSWRVEKTDLLSLERKLAAVVDFILSAAKAAAVTTADGMPAASATCMP